MSEGIGALVFVSRRARWVKTLVWMWSGLVDCGADRTIAFKMLCVGSGVRIGVHVGGKLFELMF